MGHRPSTLVALLALGGAGCSTLAPSAHEAYTRPVARVSDAGEVAALAAREGHTAVLAGDCDDLEHYALSYRAATRNMDVLFVCLPSEGAQQAQVYADGRLAAERTVHNERALHAFFGKWIPAEPGADLYVPLQ